MSRTLLSTLALAAFVLSASVCGAADSKPAAPAEGAAKSKAPDKATSAKTTPAPARLVDINSASKAELQKLPGIGPVEADKIIAGRPYGSKAWLVTHNIISGVHYTQIKDSIIAQQK